MKFRIFVLSALIIGLLGLSSCANHQYPGSYHQQGNGHARFY